MFADHEKRVGYPTRTPHLNHGVLSICSVYHLPTIALWQMLEPHATLYLSMVVVLVEGKENVRSQHAAIAQGCMK